jgi:hypothetical protein
VSASVAAFDLRVRTLESRVDDWDARYGKLLATSGEARDASAAAKVAAERAANEALNLRQDLLELSKSIRMQCRFNHQPMQDRIEALEHKSKTKDKSEAADDDEFELTTDVMNRDQLVVSRSELKEEVEILRNELNILKEAEEARTQAERDREIERRAKEKAVSDLLAEQAIVERQSIELQKERIKSRRSVILAVVSGVFAIATALISWAAAAH